MEEILPTDIWLIEILKKNCKNALKQKYNLFNSNNTYLHKHIKANLACLEYPWKEDPIDYLLLKAFPLGKGVLIDFSGVNFSGTRLKLLSKYSSVELCLKYINFDNANFSNMDIATMGLEALDLSYCRLTHANFTNSNIRNINFYKAILQKTNFYGVGLSHITCATDLSNAINLRLDTLNVYKVNIDNNMFVLSPLTIKLSYGQLKEIKHLYHSISYVAKCPSNITNSLMAETLYNTFVQEYSKLFCNIWITLKYISLPPELKVIILNNYNTLICTELVYYEEKNT